MTQKCKRILSILLIIIAVGGGTLLRLWNWSATTTYTKKVEVVEIPKLKEISRSTIIKIDAEELETGTGEKYNLNDFKTKPEIGDAISRYILDTEKYPETGYTIFKSREDRDIILDKSLDSLTGVVNRDMREDFLRTPEQTKLVVSEVTYVSLDASNINMAERSSDVSFQITCKNRYKLLYDCLIVTGAAGLLLAGLMFGSSEKGRHNKQFWD